MVRRLVKEQHVRALQQNLCELDAHTPATGELACRTVEVGPFEAKPRQCALHRRLVIVSSHHHKAVLCLRKAINKFKITFAFVVGSLRHLPLHAVKTRLHFGVPRKGLARFLAHGSIIRQLHYLRQIAYCLPSGYVYRS